MNDLEDVQSDYNWGEAFKYSGGYAQEDIVKVIYKEDGCRDESNWTGVFEMKDGKYLYLTAGCDYSGWG